MKRYLDRDFLSKMVIYDEKEVSGYLNRPAHIYEEATVKECGLSSEKTVNTSGTTLPVYLNQHSITNSCNSPHPAWQTSETSSSQDSSVLM